MQLELESIDEIRIIKICSHTLDTTNAKDFKKSIEPIIQESKDLIIDLKDVHYVDSAGCGALIHTLKILDQSYRAMKLCGVRKEVQTLLELVRVTQVIEIFNTKQEAIESF